LSEKYSHFLIESIYYKTKDLKTIIDDNKLKQLKVDEKLETFTQKLINIVVPY